MTELRTGAVVFLVLLAWLVLVAWLGRRSPPPPPVDLAALVGRPYAEAVAALKAQRPLAVVVVYRARDTGGPKTLEMPMLPGTFYMGVGPDGAYMDLVPHYYVHRRIRHCGIVGVF